VLILVNLYLNLSRMLGILLIKLQRRDFSLESLPLGVHMLSKRDCTVAIWQGPASIQLHPQAIPRTSTDTPSISSLPISVYSRSSVKSGKKQAASGTKRTPSTSNTPVSKNPSPKPEPSPDLSQSGTSPSPGGPRYSFP